MPNLVAKNKVCPYCGGSDFTFLEEKQYVGAIYKIEVNKCACGCRVNQSYRLVNNEWVYDKTIGFDESNDFLNSAEDKICNTEWESYREYEEYIESFTKEEVNAMRKWLMNTDNVIRSLTSEKVRWNEDIVKLYEVLY